MPMSIYIQIFLLEELLDAALENFNQAAVNVHDESKMAIHTRRMQVANNAKLGALHNVPKR